jgi:putative transposase
MRMRRFKVSGQVACYHVISRLVAEVPFLDDVCKEMLRKQMWKTAYYCGVTVMTYSIMGNHFHILVNVPESLDFDDAELLARYRRLYPKPNAYQLESIEGFEAEMAAGGERREKARERILSRMGDLSMFVKLLKQRFSIWYNRRHHRRGTLWGERFKSTLVENSPKALATVAAYIDLNPVRAKLAEDPKDYRFCGYAEWMAGQKEMAFGFETLFQSEGRDDLLEQYRMVLFGKGAVTKCRDGKGEVIAPEKVHKVLEEGGKVGRHEWLHCRIRYFSDGCIIGSRGFIEKCAQDTRILETFSRRKHHGSFPMRGFEALGLYSFRHLRRTPGA